MDVGVRESAVRNCQFGKPLLEFKMFGFASYNFGFVSNHLEIFRIMEKLKFYVFQFAEKALRL